MNKDLHFIGEDGELGPDLLGLIDQPQILETYPSFLHYADFIGIHDSHLFQGIIKAVEERKTKVDTRSGIVIRQVFIVNRQVTHRTKSGDGGIEQSLLRPRRSGVPPLLPGKSCSVPDLTIVRNLLGPRFSARFASRSNSR